MRYDSSTYTDLTDEKLIQLVQDGNEAAFAQLAARHSSRIWQLVVLNSRQIRDAEEIFQDIWVTVWENIGGLREVSSFGTWLRKIAYTTCRRYYTATSHTRGEILQSAEELAETIDRDVLARFRETELRAAVTEAVHDLPERVQAVAVLYYLEMWTIKEIATELGLAVGTVKTRLSQIRALLREEFGVEEVKRGRTMTHQKEVSKPSRNIIKVLGVGNAGGNVVKRMIASGLKGIEFYAVNTDLEALRTCDGATQVQIGAETTQGLGADANPEIGGRAAEEDLKTLDAIVADARMVFVTAGMGGGTGTGAAPLIASLAREQGALTIGVATRPLDSEGQRRVEYAEQGLHELQENTDAVIVVPNQRLLDTIDAELPTSETFRMSDETVLLGVKSISGIVTDSGEVNVDFTDIESIMKNAGTVLIGIGQASGENRARIAMETAIASPLLDGKNIGSATGLIVNISAPQDFMMNELDTAMKVLQDEAFDAQIIFGLVYRDDDPEPEDTVYITILAAGIEPQSEPAVAPSTQQRGSSPGGGTRVPSAATSELEQVPEFHALAELPENRELIEMSKAVEGMKRHVSTHTSAIVVSDGPLTNYVPLFKDRHDQVATQFEGKTVEDVGMVKFDSLGLRSLTETYDCLQMIAANHGVKIKLEEIPFDDKETYSLVSNGLIAGLFQLEASPGMHRVVTELKPDNFEEFCAIITLYRPGPIEKGDMQQYMDRKNGLQPVEYIHPVLEGVLKSTYGVCLYQEQVMQIAHDMAGFTLAESDILRHAMGRKMDGKNEGLLAAQREKFVEGAMKKGFTKEEIEEVFELLEPSARYAFNKAHAVAYSMLAYRMAYLKTHYPHEFMAAVMTGETSDSAKIDYYREECEKLSDFLGVEIDLPSLAANKS